MYSSNGHLGNGKTEPPAWHEVELGRLLAALSPTVRPAHELGPELEYRPGLLFDCVPMVVGPSIGFRDRLLEHLLHHWPTYNSDRPRSAWRAGDLPTLLIVLLAGAGLLLGGLRRDAVSEVTPSPALKGRAEGPTTTDLVAHAPRPAGVTRRSGASITAHDVPAPAVSPHGAPARALPDHQHPLQVPVRPAWPPAERAPDTVPSDHSEQNPGRPSDAIESQANTPAPAPSQPRSGPTAVTSVDLAPPLSPTPRPTSVALQPLATGTPDPGGPLPPTEPARPGPSQTRLPPTTTPLPEPASPTPELVRLAPSPTATSAATQQPPVVCAERWAITVEVYPDVQGMGGYSCPGCDGNISPFEEASYRLPALEFRLLTEDGRLLARHVSAPNGMAYRRDTITVCDAPPPYVLELVDRPSGFWLCPEAGGPRRLITADRFGRPRGPIESFSFWQGCPVPTPTP